MLIVLKAVPGGSPCRVPQHPGQHPRVSPTTNDAGRVRGHGS